MTINDKEDCGFDMLDYWYEKHGDIDGHGGYDEKLYRHYYPELMEARDAFLRARRLFELEIKEVEHDNN